MAIKNDTKEIRQQRGRREHARQAGYTDMLKAPAPGTWSATHRAYAGTAMEAGQGGDNGCMDKQSWATGMC